MARALVPLASGCEDLEAVTLIDVLRRGGIDVVVAGLAPGPVKGARGTVFVPDTDLERVKNEAFDLVVLPGGQPGTEHLRADGRIAELLKRRAAAGAWVAAVCAAPQVLAEAGLLEGKAATSYPGVLEKAPHGARITDLPVVVDGRVLTGRSAGMALDFALALVEALRGKAVRTETEERLVRR